MPAKKKERTTEDLEMEIDKLKATLTDMGGIVKALNEWKEHYKEPVVTNIVNEASESNDVFYHLVRLGLIMKDRNIYKLTGKGLYVSSLFRNGRMTVQE